MLQPLSLARLRRILNWIGLGILLLGFGSAVILWRAQDRIDREREAQLADPAAPLPPLDSRKQVREVEIYYGSSGVLVEQAEELLHGKPLARTIAVASVMASTGFFLVAARLQR